MVKIEVTVRGQKRNVYIEKSVTTPVGSPAKWLARTYVGPRKKTTVSGIVTLYKNGAIRFTPQGKNASLV